MWRDRMAPYQEGCVISISLMLGIYLTAQGIGKSALSAIQENALEFNEAE